jgi:hypothetical protein
MWLTDESQKSARRNWRLWTNIEIIVNGICLEREYWSVCCGLNVYYKQQRYLLHRRREKPFGFGAVLISTFKGDRNKLLLQIFKWHHNSKWSSLRKRVSRKQLRLTSCKVSITTSDIWLPEIKAESYCHVRVCYIPHHNGDTCPKLK